MKVRKPLKRRKKIDKKDGIEFIVSCKYERLDDFYFSCGMVTHTNTFCRKFMDKRGLEGEKEWGLWLKAPPRRVANQSQSRWLMKEENDTWEASICRENKYQNCRRESNSKKKDKEIIKESNS